MAADEKRVALVIGNSAYVNAMPLKNPRNDAEAMGAVLGRLGFKVISSIDLGRDAMEDKLVEFESAIGGAAAAMLFYAGHGLQVKGHNYLIPVDADIRQEIQLKRRAFSLDELLDIMVRRARASLIFLDACRDNPFSRSLLSGMSNEEQKRYLIRSGLAEVKASQGSFIAFATAPDNVAHDGTGANSPFTEAMVAHIETPGVSVSDLMIEVRKDVLRATDGHQEPWDQSSLRERFCFKALPVEEPVAPQRETPPHEPAPFDPRQVELAYWLHIKDVDAPKVFEEFLRQFPDGVYAALAKRKLEALRAEVERQEREARERVGAESRAKAEADARRQREVKEARRKAEADRLERKERERAEAETRARTEAKAQRRGAPISWKIASAGMLTLAVGGSVLWLRSDGDSPERSSTSDRQPQLSTSEGMASLRTAAQAGEVRVMVGIGGGSDEEKWFTPGEGKNESFRDCATNCPEMVVVPAGSFMMGAPEGEKARKEGESQHKVTFKQPFTVGKYAVTFAEWDACVADGGCGGYKPEDQGWGRGNRPVINVNWADAKAYADWLSKKTRKFYRLPSEAEREYVARAGTTTPFWWGTSITPDQANYIGDLDRFEGPLDLDPASPFHNFFFNFMTQKTEPVNSFQVNPWGLYQVHGNVWEWVEDCWHKDYDEAPTDGSAWTSISTPDGCNNRVLRGGYSGHSAWDLRAAARGASTVDNRNVKSGFRIVREVSADVIVRAVSPGGDAERVGLASGDRLVTYNGENVNSTHQFVALVSNMDPPASRILTVRRGSKILTFEVAAGRLGINIEFVRAEPASPATGEQPQSEDDNAYAEARRKGTKEAYENYLEKYNRHAREARIEISKILDRQIRNVNAVQKMLADDAGKVRLKVDGGLTLAPSREVQVAGEEGVAIVDVDQGSQAADKGLKSGDVILDVSGKTVTHPTEVVDAIRDAKTKGRKAILLQVRSNHRSRYIALSLQ